MVSSLRSCLPFLGLVVMQRVWWTGSPRTETAKTCWMVSSGDIFGTQGHWGKGCETITAGTAGPRFPDKSAHEGQHENAPASHGMPNHLRASSCSDQTLLRWKTDLSENQGQRRSEDDGREVWDAQRKPQETCRFKSAPSSGRWGSSLWGESFGQSR
jgi:hypothetical protein